MSAELDSLRDRVVRARDELLRASQELEKRRERERLRETFRLIPGGAR